MFDGPFALDVTASGGNDEGISPTITVTASGNSSDGVNDFSLAAIYTGTDDGNGTVQARSGWGSVFFEDQNNPGIHGSIDFGVTYAFADSEWSAEVSGTAAFSLADGNQATFSFSGTPDSLTLEGTYGNADMTITLSGEVENGVYTLNFGIAFSW